jgi:hypothetical protein
VLMNACIIISIVCSCHHVRRSLGRERTVQARQAMEEGSRRMLPPVPLSFAASLPPLPATASHPVLPSFYLPATLVRVCGRKSIHHLCASMRECVCEWSVRVMGKQGGGGGMEESLHANRHTRTHRQTGSRQAT